MEIPDKRKSPEEFEKEIRDHIETHYDKISHNDYRCKKCGSQIMEITGFVSIHFKDLEGCKGDGKVEKVPIPYCLICEGIPNNTDSCIHI